MDANSVKAGVRQAIGGLIPGALAACLVTGLLAAGSPAGSRAGSSAGTGKPGSWNPKAAAAYLDQREDWWTAWPPAARDRGTFCVSCHTAVPYGLSRPALRVGLAEAGPSASEQKLLDNVTKRVRLWNEVAPFYNDEKDGAHKTEQARGTEAVLNALILVSRDAGTGKPSDDARAALDNMWALQRTAGDDRGAWPWIQFNNEPWEAYDSQYYGACLAAVAVGSVSQDYRSTPAIQSNLQMLREYLNRESARQSPINRMVLLWASAKWPGLLPREGQESIVKEAVGLQRADGGWNLAALVGPWKRADGTPLEAGSDGYATGLITLALEQAGLPRSDPHLQQGLAWLIHNQNPADGSWPATSLNRQLDPAYGPGRFMSDAATAYAVLALTEAKSP
jgi:squalene-hopene/tetraprenyl-beta-curcumene cyclase